MIASSSAPTRRKPGSFVIALSLATSLLAGLLLAEVVVRLIAPEAGRVESPAMFVPDSLIGYRLASNYKGYRGNQTEYLTPVYTDALGMRTAQVPPKNGGTTILFLGDSFIFGQGVTAEQSMPAKVQRHLAAGKSSAVAFNAGVPGYGTRQEELWLREYGARVKPDLIVLGVFLGNDLVDNITSSRSRFTDGRFTAPPARWHTPVTRWLFEHSHVYRLARRAVDEGNGARHGATARDALTFPAPAIARKEADSTSASIGDLQRDAANLHAQLLAVLIPDEMQLDAAAGSDSLSYPNLAFARILCARGIPFIDLTGPFRDAASRGDHLYFAQDRHWNAKGHDLAARLVSRAVLDLSVNPAASAPVRCMK